MLCIWGSALGPCWGLFLVHRLHLLHNALPMLESIKVLGQGGLKGHLP
jgi:hypothetical protein